MMKTLWCVVFNKVGQVTYCHGIKCQHGHGIETDVCKPNTDGGFYIYVYADSEEDAIEIAREKRLKRVLADNYILTHT